MDLISIFLEHKQHTPNDDVERTTVISLLFKENINVLVKGWRDDNAIQLLTYLTNYFSKVSFGLIVSRTIKTITMQPEYKHTRLVMAILGLGKQ